MAETIKETNDGLNEKYVSEEELNAAAVAPRVTLEKLEENIQSEVYFTAEEGVMGEKFIRRTGEVEDPAGQIPPALSLVTYCVLILRNGFSVTGISACASPENYDEKIGRRVARGDAVRQVWGLMGYELRSQLTHVAKINSTEDHLGESLTRLTAYGLGNQTALRMSDVDAILGHFTNSDNQEEGGTTFAQNTGNPESSPPEKNSNPFGSQRDYGDEAVEKGWG